MFDSFRAFKQFVSTSHPLLGGATATVLLIVLWLTMTPLSMPVIAQPPDPPVGLTADNNGPNEVNEVVDFVAAVTSGTEISYTWDFGDGDVGSGITTSHAYEESGIYTATVVASNAAASVTATTTVYIGDAVVDVRNTSFSLRDVTIPAGGMVVWVLRGGTHSVTADDGSFEQPADDDWPPFVQTFATADVYPYYCTIHGFQGGIGMAGSVTVSGPAQQRKLLLPTIQFNE
jgi:plastocyanin